MCTMNMGCLLIEDIKGYSQHIVWKTYIWPDGLQSCSVQSNLNYVSSLHSRIEDQYERYRSVVSKYINRHVTLFRIQKLYRKINEQEIIIGLLMRPMHFYTTFFIRQIRNECIFKVTF